MRSQEAEWHNNDLVKKDVVEKYNENKEQEKLEQNNEYEKLKDEVYRLDTAIRHTEEDLKKPEFHKNQAMLNKLITLKGVREIKQKRLNILEEERVKGGNERKMEEDVVQKEKEVKKEKVVKEKKITNASRIRELVIKNKTSEEIAKELNLKLTYVTAVIKKDTNKQ